MKDLESPFAAISVPEDEINEVKKLSEPVMFLNILKEDKDPMIFWEKTIDEAKFLIDRGMNNDAAELLKQIGRQIYTYLQEKGLDDEKKKVLTEKAFMLVDIVKYLKGISEEAKPIPKFADLDEDDEISSYSRATVLESILNRIVKNYNLESIALVGIAGRILYSKGLSLTDDSLFLQSIYEYKTEKVKIGEQVFNMLDANSKGLVFSNNEKYLFLVPTGCGRLLLAISSKDLDYNLFLLSVYEELRFI